MLDAKDKEKIIEQEDFLNSLLLDVCQSQRDTIKKLSRFLFTIVIAFSASIIFIVASFLKYESNFETEQVTTTVTEMETSGDNANINNVSNGNMYNDNATHNEN